MHAVRLTGPQPGRQLASTPRTRHVHGVNTIVQLDASNRIVLPRDLRRAAGIPKGQKLLASATPGRITLEVELSSKGRISKRGTLKVWTGEVPATPLDEAVEGTRHYTR